MLTDDELRRIMPNCAEAKRTAYLPFIQQAMQEFGITTYLRESAFLAQLAHESGELRYMEEIASGAAYEGRANLGNTQPGDGKRFKGRGPIQLTGRANYTKYGQLLGLDLVNNPTIAATKEVGFRIAGQFWKLNGLNELADKQKFETITRRINGGINGLADRIKYYERARNVLSKGDSDVTAIVIETAAAAGECPNPFLRQGSSGDAVRSMQERLKELGYDVSVDGSFGPGTCAAVKSCQEKNSLTADGVVGPKTWAAFWS